MALVPSGEGSGFFLEMSVQDRNGDLSVLSYALQSADYDAAAIDAAAIRAAFLGVSDAVISKFSISFRAEEDAFAYPAVGEVQTKARIVYQIDGEVTKETLDIPAPKETIFMTLSGKGNKIVNVASVPLQTYTNVFKSGNESFISDGEFLDFMVEGRKVSTASGLRSR